MIHYTIKYSCQNRRPITLIYQKGLEISQRRIKVTQIQEKMIQGYCYEKKSIRSFKKENILAAFLNDAIDDNSRHEEFYYS